MKKTSIFPDAPSKLGETITLTCQADGYFEYCDWYHGDQVCKFEWKRWHSEVRKQTCPPQLKNRMNYVGEYDEHECKVEIKNVEVADSGNWTCIVEGYGFFTTGDIVKKQLSVDILDATRIKGSSKSSSSVPVQRKSSIVPSTAAWPKIKITEVNEGSV